MAAWSCTEEKLKLKDLSHYAAIDQYSVPTLDQYYRYFTSIRPALETTMTEIRRRDQVKQTLEEGVWLVEGLVYDEVSLNKDGDVGATKEQPDEHAKKRAVMRLKRYIDEMNGDPELQKFMTEVRSNPSKETFIETAREIFSDGIGWGQVIVFFWFVREMFQCLMIKIWDTIKLIFNWIKDFLQKYVIDWIIKQGGWEKLFSFFSECS